MIREVSFDLDAVYKEFKDISYWNWNMTGYPFSGAGYWLVRALGNFPKCWNVNKGE